ncbi:MAG: HU family DNA-binding protein [Geobacteraceae bacterium]|nr:HU family DNA-binding protein [Geobacteraceae bacterium]
MTRSELVSAVAEQAGLTKAAAEKSVKAIIEGVTGSLKNGDKLTLVGFGTFSTTARAARKGQNPQTGKKINIAASVSPKFKAGKALKDAVNTKKK